MTEVTEVYINDDRDPYVLEADGKLDLSGFRLQYPSIALQGKKGLVNNGTGMTKRTWAELLEILPSGSEGELGTEGHPLQVKGVEVVGSGGCLLLWCILHKICVLPKIQCSSVSCSSLASEIWAEG